MEQQKLGKFIAKIRIEAKLTQEQLAEKLNVTNKTVSKWERGINQPDFNTLIEISKILKVSLYELSIYKRVDDRTISKYMDKLITENNIRNIRFKKILSLSLAVIATILVIFSIIFTITNYKVNKVYDLVSCNKDFRINGIYYTSKSNSILAVTRIGYTGKNSIIKYGTDFEFVIMSGNIKIFELKNSEKIINTKIDDLFHKYLLTLNNLESKYLNSIKNNKKLKFILNFKDKNNIKISYSFDVNLKLTY